MYIKDVLQLYFIMGSQNTTKDPIEVVRQAIEGGITCFQYREKGLHAKSGEQRIALGEKLRSLCTDANIPFIVNDDIELALVLEADGIHVGQGDTPLNVVRKSVPNHFIIGMSTSTPEEAIRAEQDGADYIGVGPIYETTSKADALRAIGEEGLQAVRQAVPNMPIVAISGINETNAGHVIDAGANGISLISAISQADDVIATTSSLLKRVQQEM